MSLSKDPHSSVSLPSEDEEVSVSSQIHSPSSQSQPEEVSRFDEVEEVECVWFEGVRVNDTGKDAG